MTFRGVLLSLLLIQQNTVKAQHSHDHHSHDDTQLTLHLNHGKKWPTDQALRTNMLAIHNHVKKKMSRIHNNSITLKEYKKLGKSIKKNINTIFKNCKLPPKADAQLHIIMAGLLGSNKVLTDNSSQKEKKKAINEILLSYNTYLKFFDSRGDQKSPRKADAICFDDNNRFTTKAPEGWVADFNQAKQLGLCVIYLVKGTTFHSSPAVIYPRLLTTKDVDERAVFRIISESTERLKKKGAKKLSVVKKQKIKNKYGLDFHFRYSSNGPEPNEFEAVSYHSGKNAVLLSFFSTRSKSSFDKHKEKLKEFVMGIRSISKKELENYRTKL